MPYALEFEVPGDEDLYERVKIAIGGEEDVGMVVHLVVKTGTGLRHTEAWNSPEEHDRFHRDRVAPAVRPVLRSIGIIDPPPPHHHHELDLIDLQLST